MEGDSYRLYISGVWKKFQPTPSVGRATGKTRGGEQETNISIHALRGEGDNGKFILDGLREADFNPRPPWGGRQCESLLIETVFIISIHALRGEGDDSVELDESGKIKISIHALRGEGDVGGDIVGETGSYFNPRPPWGGRPTGSKKLAFA